MSLTDTHDFTPDEWLARQLRAALLEKDYAQVKSLMRARPLGNDFKGGVLDAAVQLNAPEIVRFIFEEEKIALSPETGMMFLLQAGKEKHREVALCLCEKLATDLGLTRSDPYTLLLEKFPAEDHAALTRDLLAETADRQDALDKMLLAAAAAKSFSLIPALLDEGADVNADPATVLYTLLKNFPPPGRADDDDAQKQETLAAQAVYDAALQKYLAAGFDDKATLDTALVVAAMQFAEDRQSETAVTALLAAGADAFGNAREAEQIMVQKFTAPPEKILSAAARAEETAQTEKWRGVFAKAQAAEISGNGALFQTLFGQDYRPADLLAPVGEDGDTGLMIAAKAGMLGQVIARAAALGDTAITLAQMTETNARHQSCLSLAADRGNLAAVMQPAYWLKQEPALLEKLESLLTQGQKQAVDMQQIKSGIRQAQLAQKASRLRLQPRAAK
jgi:hypothetical protein